MTIKQKITTSIATGALLGTILTGSAFAADLTISGNGNNSENEIEVENSNSTSVFQGNFTDVETGVVSVANTGGNSADKNTGGNVSTDTGDATSKVNVSVSGGSNTANVEPCPCDNTPTARISGNGNNSENEIEVENSQRTTVAQVNKVWVGTSVMSIANTGKNNADKNTNGKTSVKTGKSKSKVNVRVTGPSNTLNP